MHRDCTSFESHHRSCKMVEHHQEGVGGGIQRDQETCLPSVGRGEGGGKKREGEKLKYSHWKSSKLVELCEEFVVGSTKWVVSSKNNIIGQVVSKQFKEIHQWLTFKFFMRHKCL